METLRKDKVENILRHVENDNFDMDGIRMVIPPPEAYKSLENFLLKMDERLFALLNEVSAERLPGGTIVVNWRNANNRVVLCVLLGENFANFFYSPKKGVRTLGETECPELLLANKDFLECTKDLLEQLSVKQVTSGLSGKRTLLFPVVNLLQLR